MLAPLINGARVILSDDADMNLALALRRAGFLGVKLGCQTGHCGSCMIIIDQIAVPACLRTVGEVSGLSITTVEGLATGEVLHPLQQAFLDSGAVQCGFCIPGMLMLASSLLRKEPSPSEDDVRGELGRVLCRCTGYVKPVQAILSALRSTRPESSMGPPGPESTQQLTKWNAERFVRGAPVFTDDVGTSQMLETRMLWSPIAHGHIRSIDTSRALELPGVHAILTWQNTPSVLHTRAAQDFPEPSPYDYRVFDRHVRYIGDRVAAVAADTISIADEALRLISIEYEELQPLLSIEDSLGSLVPRIHPGRIEMEDNTCAAASAEVGSYDDAASQAEVWVQGSFTTQRVHHAQLEPHVAIGIPGDAGSLTIRTSTQVPFHVRRILSTILDMPETRIRVVSPPIGGGFGGKQELLLEDIVALLARKTGRAVRWALTREEEFFATRYRHPMRVDVTIGAQRTGRIVAMAMNAEVDAGAYGSHSKTVPSNTGNKNLPRYRSIASKFSFRSVYTNLPVSGAFRGYGTPQGAFALECLVDDLALSLGWDPVAFRLANIVKTGDVDQLSPLIYEFDEAQSADWRVRSCGLGECLSVGARRVDWGSKRMAWGSEAHAGRRLRRGIGVACISQGSGVARHKLARARVALTEEGRIELFVGASDVAGSCLSLVAIASKTLGCDPKDIDLIEGDTDRCPFDSGGYASSTTYLSGGAVLRCCAMLLRKIGECLNEDPGATLRICNGMIQGGVGRGTPIAELRRLRGELSASAEHRAEGCPPPFAAQFAEVEVDCESGEVRPLGFLSVIDSGAVVSRVQAEGQVEGAVVQGLGYALREEVQTDLSGIVTTKSFGDYRLLLPSQIPPIETIFLESFEPSGPYGAKSVGEIAIDGVAPAVANAVSHALGVRFRQLPITPKRILIGLAPKATAI